MSNVKEFPRYRKCTAGGYKRTLPNIELSEHARWMECPECGGGGYWESSPGSVYAGPCYRCYARGWVAVLRTDHEVEVE